MSRNSSKMGMQPHINTFKLNSFGSEETTKNSQQSQFNSLDFNTNNFWCQLCALQHSECICGFLSTSTPTPSPWTRPYEYPMTSPISPISSFSWVQHPIEHLRSVPPLSIPGTTFRVASSSSESLSSAVSTQWSNWSSLPTPLSPTFSSMDATRSTLTPSSSTPRKGKMSPDEAKEKRLQQNRRSQQSFRHRQAKLVQDLKGKVQELQKENEDLIRVISSFGDAGEIVMDRVGKRS